MFDNILQEPNYVQRTYNEYLRLINYYNNVLRKAIFVKYYNLNYLRSTSEESDSTFDIYHTSDVKFDIFDLTPIFIIQPISNRPANVQDMEGIRIDGTTSITTYTLKRPRLNDLVCFYSPVGSNEIFRVNSFTESTNMIFSEPNVNWFDLELEYAPITSTNHLKIANHYIYDLSGEKYLSYQEYAKYISLLDRVSNILKTLSTYYSLYRDFYIIDEKIFPCVNELVLLSKSKYEERYRRILEEYQIPFGYLDRFEKKYNSIEDFPFNDTQNNMFNYYDFKTGELKKYYWENRPIINNKIDNYLLTANNLYTEIINGF